MKNLRKTFTICLVIIVVVIGAGVFLYKNQKINQINQISTGDSNKYKNSKYGFEVNLPKGYSATDTSPEEVTVTNGQTRFTIAVNLATGFAGWDHYKSYGKVVFEGREIGSIVSYGLSEEERVASKVETTPYMFLSILQPDDKTFFVINSSHMNKTQIDDPKMEDDFLSFVRSFKKI